MAPLFNEAARPALLLLLLRRLCLAPRGRACRGDEGMRGFAP
eukprot:COSAG04_NODE_19737_length_409_cov_0.954839_1_plen_41_part_01